MELHETEALLLGANARTWGSRPSALLEITSPVVALVVDDALATLLRRQAASAPVHRADLNVPGMRYEGPADWGRPLHDAERQAAVKAAYFEQLRREGRVH